MPARGFPGITSARTVINVICAAGLLQPKILSAPTNHTWKNRK